MLIILALGMKRQENCHKLKASLTYKKILDQPEPHDETCLSEPQTKTQWYRNCEWLHSKEQSGKQESLRAIIATKCNFTWARQTLWTLSQYLPLLPFSFSQEMLIFLGLPHSFGKFMLLLKCNLQFWVEKWGKYFAFLTKGVIIASFVASSYLSTPTLNSSKMPSALVAVVTMRLKHVQRQSIWAGRATISA